MPVNIVKKLIKRKAVIQMCICLSILLLIFTDARIFENYYDECFALVTDKYKTVTSAFECTEHLNNGERYIKIEMDKLYPTRFLDYIWVKIPDGILIIKYPISAYNKLDFNGKNEIKGSVSPYNFDLTVETDNFLARKYPEFFTEHAEIFILDAGVEAISAKDIFTIVFTALVFLFFSVIVIKNIVIILNYKLSKEYRALKFLGHETLEDAENSVLHAYNETQSACLFDDRRIFICKKYIILKSSAIFKNTSDLAYVKEEVDYNLKNKERYSVKLKFNNIKKPMKIKIPKKSVMKEIVFILRAEIYQPTEAENIVKSLINGKTFKNISEILITLIFIVFLVKIFYSVYPIVIIIIMCMFFVLFNYIKEWQPINYKNSQSYLYLENFDYQTIEHAEMAIIRDYNINFNEHLFENRKIFISKNFIIFKGNTKFRETKKLKAVQGHWGDQCYYLDFYFNDGRVEYCTHSAEAEKIKKVLKIVLIHRPEYDTEEI